MRLRQDKNRDGIKFSRQNFSQIFGEQIVIPKKLQVPQMLGMSGLKSKLMDCLQKRFFLL